MSKTIAIVEDEADIRANYAELFQRQGYRVRTYASRREALARKFHRPTGNRPLFGLFSSLMSEQNVQ